MSHETAFVEGWGRATGSHASVVAPVDDADWKETFASAGARGLIVRGGGRSYGDAAQNGGGLVALTRAQATIRPLDPRLATVRTDAGATVGALIRALAAHGWTLPVVPGTAGVTVGGAIAADVHGKNHPRCGTFGAQVLEMAVLTPARGLLTMSPETNSDAFWATVGGLGLTGVIRAAVLRVVPLMSWWARSVQEYGASLSQVLDRLRDAATGSEHAVAWLDGHRRGNRLGAGVVTRTDAADAGRDRMRADRGPRRPRLPRLPGRGIAWPPAAACANRARMIASRARPRRGMPLPAMHFPLDAVPEWAALHGRRGLVQYQFTVPFGAEQVLADALGATRAAGHPASLAVLKIFGAAGRAPLSFPRPGWSLALDFAAHPGLAAVLDRLDEQVAGTGGRVYLVKDSRLRPDLLAAMYPELPRWQAERAVLDPDGLMISDLARRLRLTDHMGAGHA